MTGNLVGSIVGLTIATVAVAGTVYGVSVYQQNKSVGTAEAAIVSEEDAAFKDRALLTDSEDVELLTLENETEEVLEETDETEVEELSEEETTEEVTETEEGKTEEKTSEDKKEDTKKEETTVKEEVATNTTTQTETTDAPSETPAQAETQAETPTEQSEPQIIAAENLPADALVQTDAKEATNVLDFIPIAPTVANPTNDADRMLNEATTATSAEEYIAQMQAIANTVFDAEGNVVDPSVITYEEPTDTETVVTE